MAYGWNHSPAIREAGGSSLCVVFAGKPQSLSLRPVSWVGCLPLLLPKLLRLQSRRWSMLCKGARTQTRCASPQSCCAPARNPTKFGHFEPWPWSNRGQPKEALAAYQRAIKLAPDYLPALEGAAQLNYKGQSAQAAPLLRHIISLQPVNPTAHAMLGVLEYRHSDYGKAAQDFAAAEQVLDSQPSALMAYSICLARLNRNSEAMVHFQQLLAARPADAAVRYDLALLQWHSGTGADALATLQPMLDAGTADPAFCALPPRFMRRTTKLRRPSNFCARPSPQTRTNRPITLNSLRSPSRMARIPLASTSSTSA